MNRVFNMSKADRLTLFQEFSPITVIGKCLGVFPIKKASVHGNQVFAKSRAATIYSIVLLGLTFVHLIYIPSMTISTSNFVNGNNRNYSIENLRNPLATPALLMRLLNGFTMSVIAISSRINAILYVRNHLPNTFDTLKSIDSLLGPTVNQRKKNIRAIVVLLGLSIFVGLPGQIISSIFVSESQSYYIGIYMLGNNVNNFTSFSSETQFLALCCLLKSRFDIINEKLLEVKNFYNLDNRFPIDQTERKFFKEMKINSDVKFIAGEGKEFLIQGIPRFVTKNNFDLRTSIFESIKILRIGHQRLCDVLDQMNRMYQLQLLFSISGCFLNELFNMYSLFTGGSWKIPKNANFNVKAVILTHPLINLTWAIYYAFRIISMATMASKTTGAGRNALVPILDIRRTSMDSRTKEELIIFYDHVTSRRIEFSAAGLFNLNIALISSIVATGSTYLVMMVQIRER